MTLPQEARQLALRLGADPEGSVGQVHLAQSGQMRLSLAMKTWLPFTARETIATACCRFTWQAHFWPFGYLAVIDALQEGKGRLDVAALGMFAVMRAKPSLALTRAEMLRYLAELPLVPDAIPSNPALHWRVVDENHLAVSTGRGALLSEVVFALDPDGRVASASAEDRPRSLRPPYHPTPWRADYSDYRYQGGRWIPFAAEVAWQIDGQSQPYWRGTVDRWSCTAPAARGGSIRTDAIQPSFQQGSRP